MQTTEKIITIIGRDANGKIVAQDRTPLASKASQIAVQWKASGLDVEQSEQSASR